MTNNDTRAAKVVKHKRYEPDVILMPHPAELEEMCAYKAKAYRGDKSWGYRVGFSDAIQYLRKECKQQESDERE